MQSPPWRIIKNFAPLSSPLNALSLTNPLVVQNEFPSLINTTTLTSCSSSSDTLLSNVTTPGWTSHLFYPIEHAELWLPKHTLPPTGPDFPTPSLLSISSPVVTTSLPPTIEIPHVLSVDVPVYCHQLHSFPSLTKHSILTTAIMDPHLAIPFNHYFNDGYPFKALYKAYLQVKHLGIIMNSPFTTRNSITPTIKHVIHDVQTWL